MLNREASNTNFNVFGLTRSGSNPRLSVLEASTLTIKPPIRSMFNIRLLLNKHEKASVVWYLKLISETQTNQSYLTDEEKQRRCLRCVEKGFAERSNALLLSQIEEDACTNWLLSIENTYPVHRRKHFKNKFTKKLTLYKFFKKKMKYMPERDRSN